MTEGSAGSDGKDENERERRLFDPDSKSCAKSFFLFSFYGKLCQLWITDLLLNRRTETKNQFLDGLKPGN